MFIAALFTIAMIQKQLKCPSVDEWVKQLWDMYTMEYYSDVKKKKVYPLQQYGWTWRKIMLSEISQSEKEEYHTISLIWGI